MASPTSLSGSRVVVPNLNLPAGFRFHPTDEELIAHYLMNQAASIPCPVPIIAEVNIYQCNPWDLPAKALFGECEWYFFSPRDRKYPNGARPNRAAGTGYWKATGTDKAIMSTPTGHHIGVKKALIFYGGRPPRGLKTDWIMHEYRLVTAADGKTATPAKRRGSMRLDDWVLCRIHKKSNDFQLSSSEQEPEGSSTVEEESPKSEPLKHEHKHDQLQFHPTTSTMSKSWSITDLLDSIDCSALSQILDGPAADGGEALPLPQQNPPLLYPTTQALNYNNLNNNSHLNLPHVHADAICSDYVANTSNNGVNKRKRMTAAAMNDGAESFRWWHQRRFQ